jgi:hypothetical protein
VNHAAPLTVACLLVRGEYPYTAEWVARLFRMVQQSVDRPFRFVCLTDQVTDVERAGLEAIPVTRWSNCFAYWTKLELFNPARQWPGRVLYLDLDVLIVASLAPIIDAPASFALTSDLIGKTGRDSHGRAIVRRFNSSVMVWDGGTHTRLYEDWTPAAAARLSGDQDWIGEQAPEALGLSRTWFPRLSEVCDPPFSPDVKVILSKHPKNDVASDRKTWVREFWGAA